MNAAELEVLIREAFKGVTLEDGTSLMQTEVQDNYGRGVTEREFSLLPLQEITDDWTLLTPDYLEQYCYLPFLDAKGFLYYIPAFLLAVLETNDTFMKISVLGALCPEKRNYEFTVGKYKLLDSRQKHAIAHYVQALPELVELVELDEEDGTSVQRALRDYWGQYL